MLSCSRLQPNVVQKHSPLIGGHYQAADFRKIWPKNMPHVGGLYHTADFSQMWPTNMPLIGWLYHTADFSQMWPKNMPLVGGLYHIANFSQTPTCVKTLYSVFAIAQMQFWKVQSTQIRFQKVQSIFISHNFMWGKNMICTIQSQTWLLWTVQLLLLTLVFFLKYFFTYH